jgi:hypothetical protein
MRNRRSYLRPSKSPAPWGLALGFVTVFVCFAGANALTNKKNFDSDMSASVTTHANRNAEEGEVTSLGSPQRRASSQWSRNLAQGSLPQGTSVPVVVCKDSSQAQLAIERAGSDHVLSGEFSESLVSADPVTLSFSFSDAKMLEEDSLGFENAVGELHTKEMPQSQRVQKIEVKELSNRFGAKVTIETKNMQIELTHCQVNTAALLRLTKIAERQLASIK